MYVCSALTSNNVKDCSGKKHFLFGFISSTDVSALHPKKAEHNSKESQSYPAH